MSETIAPSTDASHPASKQNQRSPLFACVWTHHDLVNRAFITNLCPYSIALTAAWICIATDMIRIIILPIEWVYRNVEQLPKKTWFFLVFHEVNTTIRVEHEDRRRYWLTDYISLESALSVVWLLCRSRIKTHRYARPPPVNLPFLQRPLQSLRARPPGRYFIFRALGPPRHP